MSERSRSGAHAGRNPSGHAELDEQPCVSLPGGWPVGGCKAPLLEAIQIGEQVLCGQNHPEVGILFHTLGKWN